MAICVAALLFSCWKLLHLWLEYRQGTDAYNDAASQYTQPTETDPAPEDPISDNMSPAASSAPADSSEVVTPEPTPEAAPITVDFDALRAENPEVIGWIYCEGTPINYPVLQTTDNDKYLHQMVNGETNAAGSIFMDYRNTPDLSDCNTLIYGHNMKNNSMFGILPSFRSQSYYEEHPVMWLLTPEQDWKIVLIGGAVVDNNDDIYDAIHHKEYVLAQMDRLLSDSVFDGPEVDGEHFVTLSTCAYDFEDARLVLIGVLEPVLESQE